MYKRFSASLETANAFVRLFVNRLAYGVQTRFSDGTVGYVLSKRKPTEELIPLNTDVVRAHLNGDVTINLFSTNPKTQRCKWVAIDADFGDAIDALALMQSNLKADGVEAALEQSSRGCHLWIFFDSPVLASDARIYIYNLALRLGVPVVGGGLKQGIEVFPRQDHIDEGRFGNAIRAPLGVHRKTNLRYWFYQAAPNPEAQLAYLQSMRKMTEEQLKTFIQGMSLPEAYLPPKPTPYQPPTERSGRSEFRILDYVQINSRARDSRNWVARCPSCAQAGGDRAGDNLKISKKEPWKYQCFKGCRKEDIREALGHPIRPRASANWRA